MKRYLSLIVLFAFSGAIVGDDSWHENSRGQKWPINSTTNGRKVRQSAKTQKESAVKNQPKKEVASVQVVSETSIPLSTNVVNTNMVQGQPKVAVVPASNTVAEQLKQLKDWAQTQLRSVSGSIHPEVNAAWECTQENPSIVTAITAASFTAGFCLKYLWDKSKKAFGGLVVSTGAVLGGLAYAYPTQAAHVQSSLQDNSSLVCIATAAALGGVVAKTALSWFVEKNSSMLSQNTSTVE